MLDGGEAEPGRAVAEREHPAHGDDPLGPAQGADVLQQIMFYVESYGYYDLRLAFGAQTFIESFDFLKRKRRDQKVRTCSVGILNYVEFIIFLSVKVRES